MKLFIDPAEATEADKALFMRSAGLLVSFAATVMFLSALGIGGLRTLDVAGVGIIAIIGLVAYSGGWIAAWFFWGLFYEPQVETRRKGQRAV